MAAECPGCYRNAQAQSEASGEPFLELYKLYTDYWHGGQVAPNLPKRGESFPEIPTPREEENYDTGI